MAGADIRRFSADRRGETTNVMLGIAQGALVSLADTLVFPSIVLVLFVAQLTDDLALIALTPALGVSAWYLPQLVLTPLLRESRRQLPWATGAAVVRMASMALLAAIAHQTSVTDAERLRSFFICYAVYAAASGFMRGPTIELSSRAVSDGRGRLLLFSQRHLWGSVLAIVAGLVVQRVLGPAGPGFPRSFALLFVTAAGALAAASFFLLRMKEPLRLSRASAPTLGQLLRDALRTAVDSSSRRFLTFRVLLSASALADPFLILFAVRELEAPLSFAGVYLTALVGAQLITAPAWRRWAQRQGHRAVLQVAAAIRLGAPLTALLIPFLSDTSLFRDRFNGADASAYAFGLAFLALGIARGGQAVGNFGYVNEIAPPESRPALLLVTNSVLTVVAFAPLAGALIVERYGYEQAFLAAAAVGLLAVLGSGLLTDTHTRTRPVTQAWRLRGIRP